MQAHHIEISLCYCCQALFIQSWSNSTR
jgi:hypothetical protein